MTIHTEYETGILLDIAWEQIVEDVVLAVLEYENCPYEAEVSVILTDNAAIREVNRQCRQTDAPTDVLSFPMIDFKAESDFSHVEDHVEDCFDPETGELVLGDIMVSVEKVMEQAEAYGHSRERELAFLIAHSMLHLCGYDHMDEQERLRMEQRQDDILSGKGYHR
ncbi:MAG: rRNA maturation RNase YbeY [Lachnospiraceae bacterium]|jgi:probable rRNA maturation factor|nr:rRNA maturation RNase YbeY [Lachnospiraceae bacterium]